MRATTTVQNQLERTLRFNLILNNQSLALVVDLLGKDGRDGMMGSGILDDETLVAFNAGEDGRLLDSPGTNVGPILVGLGISLFGVRRGPSRLPVIGELLEEGSFDGRRLEQQLIQIVGKNPGRNIQ